DRVDQPGEGHVEDVPGWVGLVLDDVVLAKRERELDRVPGRQEPSSEWQAGGRRERGQGERGRGGGSGDRAPVGASAAMIARRERGRPWWAGGGRGQPAGGRGGRRAGRGRPRRAGRDQTGFLSSVGLVGSSSLWARLNSETLLPRPRASSGSF